jgi:hypothetical protein
VNSLILLTPQEKKYIAKEQKNGIDAVARIRATPRNDTLYQLLNNVLDVFEAAGKLGTPHGSLQFRVQRPDPIIARIAAYGSEPQPIMTTMALFPSYICTLEAGGWLINEMLDFGMRAWLPHWRIYDDRTLLPISTVNSVVVFETLNSMAIGALQSPRVHHIIMPVFVNRLLGHWIVFKIWCGGSIETLNSCSSYAAQLPGLARNIVRILRTVRSPAPQWSSSLTTDHQEWPVKRMTCPLQQSGGCGLHCIANACDLLLRGNVQSQTERSDDYSLRVQLISKGCCCLGLGSTDRKTDSSRREARTNQRASI